MPAGIRIPIGVDTEGAQNEINAFVSKLDKNLVLAVTAGVAAFSAMSKAWVEVMDRMQEIQPVADGFRSLTQQWHDATGTLEGLRGAALGLVSDFDLMKSANLAMTLGIADTQAEFEELTRGAVLLGNSLGLDAVQALDSLMTGMGRQSKLMLDNLGIIVDTEQAYKDYAEELGVTTAELDDNQKKLAFNAATVDALRSKVEELKTETMSMGQAWQAAKNLLSNAFDSVVTAIGNAEAFRISIGELEEGVEFWGNAMDEAGKSLTFLINIMTHEWGAAAIQVNNEIADQAEELRETGGEWQWLGNLIGSWFPEKNRDGTRAIRETNEEIKTQAEELDEVEKAWLETVAAFEKEATPASYELRGALLDLADATGDGSLALGEMRLEFEFLPPAIEPAQQALDNFILSANDLGTMDFELPDFTMPDPATIPDVRDFGQKLVDFLGTDVGDAVGNALGAGIGAALGGASAIDSIAAGLKAGLTGLVGLIPGFGPILQMIVGPLVDLFAKLFGDAFKKANAMDHVQEQFGIALSEALAGAMDDLVSSGVAGDLDAAFRLLMSDAIKAATIDSKAALDEWVTLIHQTLSSVHEGTLTISQAVQSMSQSWQALIPTMQAVGGSAMDLQDQFSDLLSRFGATPEVVDAITAAVEAMAAAGVEGVGDLVAWLNTMGLTIDGVALGVQEAAKTWTDAMEAMGVSTEKTTEQITKDQIAAIKALGLSAEVEAALIRGLKREQRELERQALAEFKQDLRDRAKALGLSREETRELIHATLKAQRVEERKAAREAEREAEKKREKLVEEAERTRDGILATFKDTKVEIPIELVAGSPGQQQQIVNAFVRDIMNQLQAAGAL
ncbi:MAG: hypothetical protein ACYTFZ_04545 [Planctomycetota bacterium]